MALVDYGVGPADYDLDIDSLRNLLQGEASSRGISYDESDLQGILRNISYDPADPSRGQYNSGVSLENAIANQLGIYDERALPNEPDTDEDGDGGGGGGGGGGRGSGGYGYSGEPARQENYPRGLDPQITERMLGEVYGALQRMNDQPDVDVSQIDPGAFPHFTVPGEAMGPAIDDTLLDLMEGEDPFGLTTIIQNRLADSAGGGVNSARLQNRLEAARENLSRGQAAALADLRAVLADRGLISQPGVPQGMELDATVRAFEPLQRSYLENVRGIEFDESVRADERETETLQIATGWTRDQVNRRLAAAQTAQERQRMMSEIALNVLDRNITWNKFLAEFGLEREKVAEQMRQGRMNAIAPILSMFTALVSQSRGGFIGRED